MKRRTRKRRRKEGRGRTLITLLLLSLIAMFGYSIYSGRKAARKAPGRADVKVASLEQPALPPPIIPTGKSPTLTILNGSGRSGLAARAETWMRSSGFNVFDYGNADRSDYHETLVVIRSGREKKANEVASFVKERLGVGRIVQQGERSMDTDAVLILGSDFPDSLLDRRIGRMNPESQE